MDRSIADRPQPSPDGRRIFFRGRLERGNLVQYDPKSDQWLPYLQGLPAMQVDYSGDGKWIAYANYSDGSIWRAAVDGSQRLKLSSPPIFGRNPHWSPDGTQIVFYGAPIGQPERVYVVPSTGGAVRQVTNGAAGRGTSEGDGIWSADGASIIFGAFPNTIVDNRPDSRYLAVLNLATGTVSKPPGSEGLWSARVSRDGRYESARKRTLAL